MEQLIGIIRGADGLITTLNGIDGNLSADVDISVNRKTSAADDTYTLGVKGNINASSPEFVINFKSNSTENIALGYKSNKIYLKQPLTGINKNGDGSAAAASDAVAIDITALSPSVGNLMTMLMKVLKDINLDIDMASLADALEDLLTNMNLDLDELIVFKEITNGNRLEVTASTMDMLNNLLLKNLFEGMVGDVADTLVNSVFDTDDGIDFILDATIFIEVYKNSAGTINGLKLGFNGSDNTSGNITININKFSNSASDKATIAFGNEYASKSLNLNVGASLPQKGIAAILDATATPDFSTNNKVLASGTISFFDPNQTNATPYVIPGYFNGSVAYFNTAAGYQAINELAGSTLVSVPGNTLYKASVYKTTSTGNENTNLVAVINEAIAKMKADFDAGTNNETETEVSTGPSKSIIHSIYELIGGKLETETKDNVTSYKEITEVKMLQQLNTKFGAYTRFKIYESKKTETYGAVIDNITKLFDDNKDWIIGTAETQAAGNYGIFNWNKTNWNGGVTLYKADANNDLLDAVNVFLCKEGNANITTDDISDFANYYISMLNYYMVKDDSEFADYVAAIDAADKALLIAKNVYLASNKNDTAKTALENAKKAYKEAMEDAIFGTGESKNYAIANELLSGLLGVDTTGDMETTNVMKEFIEGGLYIGIGCIKGQGLNGSITIADSVAQNTIYLNLNAKISLTDTVAAANIEDVEGAIEIAKDFVAVTAADEDEVDYRVIAKWDDGTKKVYTTAGEGHVAGDFIYEMDGDKYVYNNRNTNAEGLLDELFALYLGYIKI